MKTITPTLRSLEPRVTPSTIAVTTTADAGAGSLRAALLTADTLPGKDTINFHLPAPPINSENIITLTSGALTSDGNVTIAGPGAGKLIVNGNAASGVFAFDDGGTTNSPATISGLSIVNGKTGGFGGGVYSLESLTLKNVVISGNQANAGGGVWVKGDNGGIAVSISSSLIVNNTASGAFGGLDIIRVQSISIVKSSLSGNTAASNGGGAYLSISTTGTKLSVTGSSITGNSASVGGGLFVRDLTASPKVKATISGCTISNNTSTNTGGTFGGGGLYLKTGDFSVSNCTISNNSAVYLGGGIQVNGFSSLTISKSTISGNRTTATNSSYQGGGGILIEDTGSGTLKPASITGCTISQNSSAEYGGGIYALKGVQLTVSGSNVSANHATRGGGMRAAGTAANRVDVTLIGATFANNLADASGGGIYVTGDGKLSMNACRLVGNKAVNLGGGILASSSLASNGIVIKNTSVTGNFAGAYGGGLQIQFSPDFHITGGSITNNSAGISGGGVHTSGSSGSVQGASITGNVAVQLGGGFFLDGGGTVSVQAKNVKANTAPLNPNFDGAFTFI